MANNEPAATKTVDARMFDSRTQAEIDASADMGNKIAVGSDTEDITFITLNDKKKALVEGDDIAVGDIITTGTVDGRDVSVDGTKLDTIAEGAEVNQDISGKQDILSEGAFVDGDKTNLDNQSGTNTGDQDLTALATKANVLELDNTDEFTPDADYEPATKKYVDENGGSGDAITIQGVPVSEDVPAYEALINWLLVLFYYWNFLMWSEDYTQSDWTKTAGTTVDSTTGDPSPITGVDYQGIIGANGTQSNYFRQACDLVVGKNVMEGYFKEGLVDSVRFRLNEAIDHGAYTDLNTGSIHGGSDLNIDIVKITKTGGNVFVQLEITATQTAGLLYIYPANGANSTTTGDGVTTSTFLQGLMVRPGTIADNFPYIKTEGTTVSAPAYKYEEKDSGKLVNTATGALEVPTVGLCEIAVITTPAAEYYDGIFQGKQVYRQEWIITNPTADTLTSLGAVPDCIVGGVVTVEGFVTKTDGIYCVQAHSSSQPILCNISNAGDLIYFVDALMDDSRWTIRYIKDVTF